MTMTRFLSLKLIAALSVLFTLTACVTHAPRQVDYTAFRNSKPSTILVLPPNPGTNGCAALILTGGDSYSVAFLAGDGLVTNKGAQLYKHKKVTLQGTCIVAPPTTTTSTTTAPTTTTTTTLYGSPSRAFIDRVLGLLD